MKHTRPRACTAQEKLPQREAYEPQRESSLHLPQLEEALQAAMKTQCNQKYNIRIAVQGSFCFVMYVTVKCWDICSFTTRRQAK